MFKLLNSREQLLNHNIKKLEQQREFLCQRRSLLEHISTYVKNINKPFVEWIPERRVLFSPFESDIMDRSKLHLALMKAWDQIIDHGMLPSKGFGAIIRIDSIKKGTPLKGAGSIINIPLQEYLNEANIVMIPAGEYVTMFKYGMPYDIESVYWLLNWMRENNYEPSGDIVDFCLLDTTFYNEQHQEDFCRLEIPIA